MAKRKAPREKDQDAAANRAAEQEHRAQMQVEALLSQGKDSAWFLQHQANTVARAASSPTPYISGLTTPEAYREKTPSSYVLPTEEVPYLLGEAAKISDQKRQDYAGADPDENFIESAKFSGRLCRGLPETDCRRSTTTLIGVKLARMLTIGLSGIANHESLDDTLTDLINYTAILIRQNMRARRAS